MNKKYIPLTVVSGADKNNPFELHLKHGIDDWLIRIGNNSTTIYKNLQTIEFFKGELPDPINYLQQKLFFQWFADNMGEAFSQEVFR